MSTFINNGPGVQIGYIGGNVEFTANDPGKRQSLCEHCAHRKYGKITIGEDIVISGEHDYCATPGIKQMQIVGGAIVKCSKFQEGKSED